MSWRSFYFRPYRFSNNLSTSRVDSFRLNEQCFIRKGHKCGKNFGASKSCFIACPENDELETIIALIMEKLTKEGYEPIVAVKERAYGQDIFCTKICGKIIESRFCIVILDDAIEEKMNIPNPNVYYEYGLMTALGKHIIPLQKRDLKLAFNIQSYDTIKYTGKNISFELDRAIKDAIRITEKKEKSYKVEEKSTLYEKTLLRKLEMAGFNQRDDEWFLHSIIKDTNFKGFGQDEKTDKPFYLYLGKIDNINEFKEYLNDLGIVIFRTEHKEKELQKKLSSLKEKLKNVEKITPDSNELLISDKDKYLPYINVFGLEDESNESLTLKIEDIKNKLFRMSIIFIGFIINKQLNADGFAKKAEKLIQNNKRYKLCLSSEGLIKFDDISITFSTDNT